MSETEINDTTQAEIEVPVLEIEFNDFLKICEKINIVDSGAFISMPNHSKSYSDKENVHIKDIVTELLNYQREENKWRLTPFTLCDVETTSESFKIGNKTLFDSSRIIIISKMNSAFIIPGEKSIAEGGFLPNEILKVSNMISSQLFLLRFTDVKNEEQDGYDLKIQYSLIDRTAIQDNHED